MATKREKEGLGFELKKKRLITVLETAINCSV